jgi:integrase/recombinase XerD
VFRDYGACARPAERTWRGRELSSTTIRRKLAALSSLLEHLCDANAVTHNPVKGVKRPKVENYEGKTPGLGDGGQAGALLDAPARETQKGKRDRAILSVLLYHRLRREELCTLKVRDIHRSIHLFGRKAQSVVALHDDGPGHLDVDRAVRLDRPQLKRVAP